MNLTIQLPGKKYFLKCLNENEENIMQDISAYINEHIISATEKMNDGNFIKAEEEIHTTLEIDKNNYELIFMLALCFEQEGKIEDAYYAYKLALFLSKGTDD